jgi:hypothetical protein
VPRRLVDGKHVTKNGGAYGITGSVSRRLPAL